MTRAFLPLSLLVSAALAFPSSARAETVAVRVPGRAELAGGETVRLTWPPDAVHRFDATTGRRLEHDRPALANA